MKVIKGASGFGDAIYLRAIVEWLLENRPDEYLVLTKYPNVYADLSVQTDDLHSTKYGLDYYCHYLHGKHLETTQWEDMLNKANIPYFPLTSKLSSYNTSLFDSALNKTVLVIKPYNAMNGAKGTTPLIPKFSEVFSYASQYANVVYLNRQYPFLELVKMFNSCKLVISQVGWAVPLAEMLNTPIQIIFTKRAMFSNYNFISRIKPKKILTKSTSEAIIME